MSGSCLMFCYMSVKLKRMHELNNGSVCIVNYTASTPLDI